MGLQLNFLDFSDVKEEIPKVIKKRKAKKDFFEIRSCLDPQLSISQTTLSKTKQKIIKSLLQNSQDIYVFGKSGSGKTRILNAIVNDLRVLKVRAQYLSAAELIGHLNVSIEGNTLKKLADYYSSYDYLLVDDAEGLLTDQKSIYQLCYFVDHIFKNKLVMASNINYKSIRKYSEKLFLRLSKFAEFGIENNSSYLSSSRHLNNYKKLISQVAEYYSINHNDFKLRSRKRECVLPRQIAWYLLHKVQKQSYLSIAKVFERDHTTVMHGVKKIGLLKDKDENVAIQIDDILKKMI